MKSRKKVLLYNPKSVFYDMPLALLAIGSELDSSKYEVVVIDGRIEENILEVLKENLDGAICFGVTVLSGYPLNDALEISKKVKELSPETLIIWGGWHVSIIPVQVLEEHSFIDMTTQGQGEVTFNEAVRCIDEGKSLASVNGICYRHNGKIIQNPPRPMQDMNSFQRVNYELIAVEEYFKRKRRRQFDLISSTGCSYRCHFCADPLVYRRKHSFISPERLIEHIAYYQDQYHFTDLNFQDETFFSNNERIRAFAQGLIDRNIQITWAATMRADQGNRMDMQTWRLTKQSGLRRVLIGVESGSQDTLDRLNKDISISQVFTCAERCKELGISAIFSFIVGFPEETDESVSATIEVIKKLRKLSPDFETPVFYFNPYPGSGLPDNQELSGYKLPRSTVEWGKFDYIGSSGPWMGKVKEKYFANLQFYLRIGYGRRVPYLFFPLKIIARWRCKHDRFGFPAEKHLAGWIMADKKLS